MCKYQRSQIYNDLNSTIRLAEGVVYLSMKDDMNSEIRLSFNPKQARVLGEYLQVAGEEQEKSGYNPDFYGNIDVDYEFANDNIEIPF